MEFSNRSFLLSFLSLLTDSAKILLENVHKLAVEAQQHSGHGADCSLQNLERKLHDSIGRGAIDKGTTQ
jgi:hypothetical protein